MDDRSSTCSRESVHSQVDGSSTLPRLRDAAHHRARPRAIHMFASAGGRATCASTSDALMLDNITQTTTTTNVMDHEMSPQSTTREPSSQDMVAYITSGAWENSESVVRADQAAQTPQRTRQGRTIASAFARHHNRDRIGHSQGSPSRSQYTMTTAVMESRNRDALRIATVNRPVPPPVWLNKVLNGGQRPSLNTLLQDCPIIDPTKELVAPAPGVIRLVDPPYSVTKAEVLSCLGRYAQVNSQPAGTPYHAVHIMMARDTGKTMDVFVEVSCHQEAVYIAKHFERRDSDNRMVTLGRMPAQVQLSSPEEMMKATFPFAKKVTWHGSVPSVSYEQQEIYSGVYTVGFDGFLGEDESALMLKWLSEPARSPFTARGPSRLYESVITLLHKYPVYTPKFVLLKDRLRVFKIARAAVKSLATILTEEDVPVEARLDSRLLQEVIVAALTFPIFSDMQKAEIFEELRQGPFRALCFGHGMPVHLGGLHEYASRWPLLGLIRQPGSADNVVRYYCMVMGYEAHHQLDDFTEAEIAAYFAARSSDDHADEPFLAWCCKYGRTAEDMPNMDLATCIKHEQEYVEHFLHGPFVLTETEEDHED